MKPQLAHDADLAKLPFPVWGMPKIDGVRALHPETQLVGRSLDPFKGFGITEHFSRPDRFKGLDGEMTLGDNPASPDRLCSLTTGAMGRFKGVTERADLHWHLFDYVTAETVNLPYGDRYTILDEKYRHHLRNFEFLHIVGFEVIRNFEEAVAFFARCLDLDYEGAIWRNYREKAKGGKPDKHQQLMRSKPWVDSEMLCTGITEGDRNENEAKTNTLGRTERSSSKDGKVPNGLVGTLQGTLIGDVVSPVTGRTLFKDGLPVNIGAGELDAKERKHLFEHPDEVVGHIVKFKHLAHGTKDQPRMGTYISHRLKEDM